MIRPSLPRRVLLKIAVSVAFALSLTIAITWAVQSKLAEREAMQVIDSVLDDVQGEIEEYVNRKLVLAAMKARDRISELPDLSAKTLRTLAEELRVDEVCVIDSKGVLIGTVNPGEEGFDFHDGDGQAKDFLCLLDTESEYCQSLRPSSANGELRKYVGVWCPEGGFVQVGCLVNALRLFAQSALVGLTHNRHVAGTGTVIVAAGQGSVISSASEVCMEGAMLKLPDDDRSYVVKRTIEGFDVYAILPKAAAAVERNTLIAASAVMTILALCFVAILVGIVISRFARAEVEKRIQAEMAMAKAIQTNVLPSHFPPYPALADKIDIFARTITAKEVGGDFYDFYFAGSKKLALVVADVSGKGVPAALFMMRARATIQGYLKSGCDIVEAVGKANHRLATNNDASMLLTAWIGIVDLTTGEVEYVNAGHNPPIVKRHDGSVDYLRGRSDPPFAAMDGVSYQRQTIKLEPGDGLLLYTDGVTEATDRNHALYGEDRLLRTMRGLLGAQDAGALIGGVLRDLDAFVGGTEQADDITMLAFKLVGLEKGERR